MKVHEVITQHPICCHPGDTVQRVAKILRDEDIGAMPIVSDRDSKRLVGIVTDRDICCNIVAKGLDPTTTPIEAYMTRNLITCRPEQSLDSCERLMQMHQIRRILIVDEDMRCVGILSGADIARSEQSHKVHKTVAEISKPSQTIIAAPAAA
jgi:CBS domain-containing protein